MHNKISSPMEHLVELQRLALKHGGRLLRSITEEGAAALAEVVDRSHLKELNIYMNDIGDGGALKARRGCIGGSCDPWRSLPQCAMFSWLCVLEHSTESALDCGNDMDLQGMRHRTPLLECSGAAQQD